MEVKYIIGHWTGGNYSPCSVDRASYQLLIDGDGVPYIGTPIGKACSIGGMNSITVNISCCGGLERTPLKKKQIEAFYKNVALNLKVHKLSVDKFYTHAEIGEKCANGSITKLLPYNEYLKQNIGKIDLTKIPLDDKGSYLLGSPKETGDYIRGKIKWYLEKI